MTIVAQFHKAFGLDAPTSVTIPSEKQVRFRLKLIKEEFEEVEQELVRLANGDFDPMQSYTALGLLLKELCDLRYVVDGTAVAFGLPIEDAYREVHRSNMSKLGGDGKPIYREDGKVLKGPNYTPADMEQFVMPIEVEGELIGVYPG